MHVPLVVKGKLGKTSKRLKILWKWLQVFLLRELAGYESGFLGKQSPLTILFCLHLLPSKQFLVFKTSWRRLQDVFSVTIFRLWGRLLKTSCKYVLKASWRRLEDVFKTYLQDVFKMSSRRLEDVLEDEKWLHWRRLGDKQNVYWNISIKPWPTYKSKSVFNKSISHKSLLHQS